MTNPRYSTEWKILADLAAHLLAERVAKYPAVVAAGKMEQQQADTGIRIMRAVALQWRAIVDRGDPTDWPEALGATWSETRETLIAAAARTRQIAAADKGNQDKADYADAVHALVCHQQPYKPGADLPAIVFALEFNHWVRRDRQAHQQAEAA